jgi:hypothetical protein
MAIRALDANHAFAGLALAFSGLSFAEETHRHVFQDT